MRKAGRLSRITLGLGLSVIVSAAVAAGFPDAGTAMAAGAAAEPLRGWAPKLIDNSFGTAQVSCASSSFCASVEGAHAVTYDGTTWATPAAIDSHGAALTSVSCPSARFCAAIDFNGNGRVLTYNGTGWSAPATIDPNAFLASVSCPSASFLRSISARERKIICGFSIPTCCRPSTGRLLGRLRAALAWRSVDMLTDSVQDN